jgi:hypothetical protein
MRTFVLRRSEDVSGISGTGDVAEGVVFDSGKVVVAWNPHKTLAKVTTVVVFDSVDDVVKLHGHDGRTRVEWQEASTPAVVAEPPPAPKPEREPEPMEWVFVG